MKKEFGLIFWIHLILIILSYSSFLYLDWKLIVLGIVLLQIYYIFRGGCDLTFREFGNDKDTTFVWYYLRKLFPNLNQHKTKIFVRYVFPILLIVISFYTQKILNYSPIINI